MLLSRYLFSTAKPEQGDFSGSVIEHDQFTATDLPRGTNYRGTIQSAVDNGIPTHGIDLNKRVDQEGEERMVHWLNQINKGPEPIKILLVGGGHLWNNPKKTPDLMFRLKGTQWVIENEKAYSPPGFNQTVDIDISASVETNRNYKIIKYSQP